MSGEQLHPWPDGYEGAVSLTFDDGMRSQLEVALPILAENGLRATFYVNSRGPDWRGLLAPWKAVAEAGHEVGNHTVSHPCSCAFKESRADCLETMTLDDMEREVIRTVLDSVEWNRRQAAERLGIGERTLYRKVKRYGLEEDDG